MQRPLDWHVYESDNDLRAMCALPEEAACLVSMLGDGATIRFGRNRIVWTEGSEDYPAAESYDHVADVCYRRAGADAARNGSQSAGGTAMLEKTYEELLERVTRLQQEGKFPAQPSREQIADWAYGNTKIENDAVTREMAEQAVNEIYGHGS